MWTNYNYKLASRFIGLEVSYRVTQGATHSLFMYLAYFAAHSY